MHVIHYNECPVCRSNSIFPVLKVKDYTVSAEEYEIMECKDCSLRFTQDIPDQQTIGKYYKAEEYISHTDTSKGLINNLYQKVRKRTLKQKRKLIERYTGLQRGFLLDIGSGTGAFANEMTRAGWQVTALEPDETARENAKQLYGLESQSTENFFQLAPSSFNAITMWHVLEHVHQLQQYIDKLKLLLKPKGKLFIAVPNYTSKDAQVYDKYWAAYDVPRHLYHFAPQSMKVLMESHGLTIEKHLPMWYDSFYVSMLSSKYKKGRTNLIGSVMKGLSSNLSALGDVKKCSSVIYVISTG